MSDSINRGGQIMKHLIAAVSLSVLAAPAAAFDFGAPFEQTQFDRELPSINVVVPAKPYRADRYPPFEQNQLDRGLPLEEENLRYATAPGGTMSDASMGGEGGSGESPWSNDHNIISPAQ
jgi:hypothetical protein